MIKRVWTEEMLYESDVVDMFEMLTFVCNSRCRVVFAEVFNLEAIVIYTGQMPTSDEIEKWMLS